MEISEVDGLRVLIAAVRRASFEGVRRVGVEDSIIFTGRTSHCKCRFAGMGNFGTRVMAATAENLDGGQGLTVRCSTPSTSCVVFSSSSLIFSSGCRRLVLGRFRTRPGTYMVGFGLCSVSGAEGVDVGGVRRCGGTAELGISSDNIYKLMVEERTLVGCGLEFGRCFNANARGCYNRSSVFLRRVVGGGVPFCLSPVRVTNVSRARAS